MSDEFNHSSEFPHFEFEEITTKCGFLCNRITIENEEIMFKVYFIFFLGVFVIFPADAQDISYLDDWITWEETDDQRVDVYLEAIQNPEFEFYPKKFKPLFFAKEMVKICKLAREGMMAKYFSPNEYSESMKSYNRQLEKFVTDFSKNDVPNHKELLGAMESLTLNSREYTFQKSKIISLSFNEGYKECNQWKMAIQMTEWGL